MSASRARTSASEAEGSASFIFTPTDREYMKAARSPSHSAPAKRQNFRPWATPRSARSAALFARQIPPSSRKRVNASPQSALNTYAIALETGGPRHRITLGLHPVAQVLDQRTGQPLPGREP